MAEISAISLVRRFWSLPMLTRSFGPNNEMMVGPAWGVAINRFGKHEAKRSTVLTPAAFAMIVICQNEFVHTRGEPPQRGISQFVAIQEFDFEGFAKLLISRT